MRIQKYSWLENSWINYSDSIFTKSAYHFEPEYRSQTYFFVWQPVKNTKMKIMLNQLKLLENNLEKFPSNTSAQILLSKTYAQLGKYHQAVQQLKSACEQFIPQKHLIFILKKLKTFSEKSKIDFDTNSITNS